MQTLSIVLLVVGVLGVVGLLYEEAAGQRRKHREANAFPLARPRGK